MTNKKSQNGFDTMKERVQKEKNLVQSAMFSYNHIDINYFDKKYFELRAVSQTLGWVLNPKFAMSPFRYVMDGKMHGTNILDFLVLRIKRLKAFIQFK